MCTMDPPWAHQPMVERMPAHHLQDRSYGDCWDCVPIHSSVSILYVLLSRNRAVAELRMCGGQNILTDILGFSTSHSSYTHASLPKSGARERSKPLAKDVTLSYSITATQKSMQSIVHLRILRKNQFRRPRHQDFPNRLSSILKHTDRSRLGALAER